MKVDYNLKEDEYLLKIRPNNDGTQTGFLTKLTKKGDLPVAFENWETQGWYGKENKPNYPITLHKENFSKGWKLLRWRFGQSQNWATVIHPKGFTLEIYLKQFLEIVQENTIVKGEIQGEFKWENNILIKNK